jgi:hypothetical protein
LSHTIPNSKRPLFWVPSLIHPCTEIRVSWDLVAVSDRCIRHKFQSLDPGMTQQMQQI